MNLDNRKYVVVLIVIAICSVFLTRLFYLQVIDDEWKSKAVGMSERVLTIYPSRGLIYDRHGELLVSNKAVYDLMILPKAVKNLDTLAFCELVGIDTLSYHERWRKATSWPNVRYKASSFAKGIPAKDFAPISEQLYKYPGFYAQARTQREYPQSIGGHVLGQVGEVSQKDLENDEYYRMGDYIGNTGIEYTYEQDLRGTRGARHIMVDVNNIEKGPYEDGEYDTPAESGKDLVSTLDAQLQAFGEALMQNKRGSIVAIEPSTGEILTMVSAPSYDPNSLVGRKRGENYAALSQDTLKPLYNRAIMGKYRPGSIFKMVQALIAMEKGDIVPSTRFRCNRGIIGCHGPHFNDDLEGAIIHSCNPYFYAVSKRMIQEGGSTGSIFRDARLGLASWRKSIVKFGLGSKLATDLPNVKSGYVPDLGYYDRMYGEGRWAYSTIYSISIGEGELGIVPLQMANLACIIANRGYYHIPHLVKKIGLEGEKRDAYKERISVDVEAKHFTPVVNAMEKVVSQAGGTARRARIPGITVCGKTGTVQNDPLPDHSVFMAFAPKDNPKIAIAVYVEYAGFGGTWAAPIASLMIEQYLTGEIKEQAKADRIFEANFLDNEKGN